MLICCCLALIIFVRRQVRKTEQGTEIQQYIRKKKESGDISAPKQMLGVNQNGHRKPKLSWDQSNTYTQTNTLNNAQMHGHRGHMT